MYSNFKPAFGSAFYHLNQSLLPEEVWSQLGQPEDKRQPLLAKYDAYGFEIEPTDSVASNCKTDKTDDGVHQVNSISITKTNKNGEQSEKKDDEEEETYLKRKAQWIRYLESEYQKLAPSSPVFDLANFDADLDRSAPLLDQLMASAGPITNELRPFFWMRLSRALRLKITSRWTFTELCDQVAGSLAKRGADCKNSKTTGKRNGDRQIQVTQVLPTNVCFQSADSICAQRLKRVLAIAQWHQKLSGGSRGAQQRESPERSETLQNNSAKNDCPIDGDAASVDAAALVVNQPLIAAYLLLVCNEEDTFWLLAKLSVDLATSADLCTGLLLHLLERASPRVAELLRRHDIDLSLIALNWFASAFAGAIKEASVLYALWDLLFYEGPIFLVQFTLGLLIVESGRLVELCSNAPDGDFSAQLFNELSDLPLKAFSVENSGALLDEDMGMISICVNNSAPRTASSSSSSFSSHRRLLKKVTIAWKAGKNVVNVIDGDYQAIPQSLFYYSRPVGGRGSKSAPSHFSTGSLSSSSPSSSGGDGISASLLNGSNSSSSAEYPSAEYLRLKNVKQTQLMVNLHEAIVAIAHHFQAYNLDTAYRLEPEFEIVLTRPTTLNLPWRHSSRRGSTDSESHLQQQQQQHQFDGSTPSDDLGHRLRPFRRAKALIDFVKQDNDELGFRRNDIITIVNEKDEHCWIGELNGEMGWFPAKFVELLDERSLDYAVAGDDSVVPFINDLVRGKLCTALKGIFFYDLRRTSYFVPVHPWTVLEEVHGQLASGGEFKHIYSRLVLTKTFRLDEFARVLSPSELLYRSISQINHWYGPQAPMDVKFRSLIAMGLNQYVLHDWLQLLCLGHAAIVRKHYGPNSFLSAPVWKMIKAELK